MAKPKFILSLQSTHGKSPKVSYEVTGNKAEKILAIIDPDIKKANKKRECTSITLEQFFH